MGKVDIDLSNETLKSVDFLREPWHPEKAKMGLAYRVLGGILFVFIITFISSCLAKIGWMDSTFSNALVELCKTGLLPIVTLILGHYFNKYN